MQPKEIAILGIAAGAVALIFATTSVDPNGPDQTTRVVNAEFASFGACVFEQMNGAWPAQVRRDDRRSEGVITVFYDTPQGSASIRPMEVMAKKISSTKTEVRVRVLSNKDQAWATIEPCAGPNGYQTAEAVAYPIPVGA